jgi:integrase
VASCWIESKRTAAGERRWRVVFRLGGRESPKLNGGTFGLQRDARTREGFILGEIAAGRIPDIAFDPTPTSKTFAEVAAEWQASRIDVRDATTVQHRSAIGRVLPTLGHLRVDEISAADIAAAMRVLHEKGKARETLRKSLTAVSMILDFAGRDPNPARNRTLVRLPREEREEIEPPTADHVEAVARSLSSSYGFAVVVLDTTGARVGELEAARVGDLDYARQGWRVRAVVSKTKRSFAYGLPDDLWAELLDRLPPPDDRDPEAPLFGDVTANRLRMQIRRACVANGVPIFSPHDLRHRRISLLHRQGVSWAEIAELVGHRSKALTADTYSHVLVDPREIDRAALLPRV